MILKEEDNPYAKSPPSLVLKMPRHFPRLVPLGKGDDGQGGREEDVFPAPSG